MATLVRRSASSPITFGQTSQLDTGLQSYTFLDLYGSSGPTLTDMIGLQNQQRRTGTGLGYYDQLGNFNQSLSYTPYVTPTGPNAALPSLNLTAMSRMTPQQRSTMSQQAQNTWNTTEAAYLSSSRQTRAATAAVTGGYATPTQYKQAGYQPPSYSYNWFQMDSGDVNSPFSNTRYDMLGNATYISRDDPRHTATAYQGRYGDLYNQYVNYQISGSQLFTGAMRQSVARDTDELNTNNWSPTQPANIRINFSGSGGGSISGTGISFPGLSGRKFW